MSASTPNRPARGRKTINPDGDAGPEIPLEEQEEHLDHDEQLPEGTYLLLDEGDIITTSITMPVLLEGHARETYIGTKITTRVREDEPAELAAARARSVAMGSILDQVEEAEDQLRQYADRQAAMLARAGVRPQQ